MVVIVAFYLNVVVLVVGEEVMILVVAHKDLSDFFYIFSGYLMS